MTAEVVVQVCLYLTEEVLSRQLPPGQTSPGRRKQITEFDFLFRLYLSRILQVLQAEPASTHSSENPCSR